jgi:hypothetical protein
MFGGKQGLTLPRRLDVGRGLHMAMRQVQSIGKIKALFTSLPPPARLRRRLLSTPRLPAAAARSKAWRGNAQSGQAAQDALG